MKERLGPKKSNNILKDNINNPLIKKGKSMKLETGIYSPICDVGVGPFAFEPGSLNYIYKYLLNQVKIKKFITKLSKKGIYLGMENSKFLSSDCKNQNKNPRCFIAVEIEGSNNIKHLMGSVLNCSLMGKIGILISFDEDKMNRAFQYFKEMIERGKTKPMLKNVIFVLKPNFDSFMRI